MDSNPVPRRVSAFHCTTHAVVLLSTSQDSPSKDVTSSYPFRFWLLTWSLLLIGKHRSMKTKCLSSFLCDSTWNVFHQPEFGLFLSHYLTVEEPGRISQQGKGKEERSGQREWSCEEGACKLFWDGRRVKPSQLPPILILKAFVMPRQSKQSNYLSNLDACLYGLGLGAQVILTSWVFSNESLNEKIN